MKKLIRLAHSPDADDIFMFAAIARGWVSSAYSYDACAADIQTLNASCYEGTYDVCAISFALFPKICAEYALLRCATSFGEGYGPKLIKRAGAALKRRFKVALSGADTTNALIFRRAFPEAKIVYKNFLDIEQAVLCGEVDAGVLIHESILNIAPGLEVFAHLWDLWAAECQRLAGRVLPLPLGGMAIRRSLVLADACRIERELAKAVEVGVRAKRALSRELLARKQVRVNAADLDTYLGLYANEHSVLLSEEQLDALDVLFTIAHELDGGAAVGGSSVAGAGGGGVPLVRARDHLLPQEYLSLRFEN